MFPILSRKNTFVNMGSQVILTILRVLVVVIALGIVGVGVWGMFFDVQRKKIMTDDEK